MKTLIGYVRYPSNYDGKQLVELFTTIKDDLGIDFYVSRLTVFRKNWIEMVLYSDERSELQDCFEDDLYRLTVGGKPDRDWKDYQVL